MRKSVQTGTPRECQYVSDVQRKSSGERGLETRRKFLVERKKVYRRKCSLF